VGCVWDVSDSTFDLELQRKSKLVYMCVCVCACVRPCVLCMYVCMCVVCMKICICVITCRHVCGMCVGCVWVFTGPRAVLEITNLHGSVRMTYASQRSVS